MMVKMIALAATVAALPAAAETACATRPLFLDRLSRSYAEAPVAMGLVSNGFVLEVLASANGSWTIILTEPNGTSCVVATGEAWQSLPRLAAGPSA